MQRCRSARIEISNWSSTTIGSASLAGLHEMSGSLRVQIANGCVGTELAVEVYNRDIWNVLYRQTFACARLYFVGTTESDRFLCYKLRSYEGFGAHQQASRTMHWARGSKHGSIYP
jgi:hypothetical protein